MKIQKLLAVGALAISLTLTSLAQHMHGQAAKQEEKSSKSSDMMGKPTAEQTVDGLRIQLWVITQEEHKKLMQDQMKSGMGGMNHEMMTGKKDTAMAEHKMEGEMQHDMAGMDHSKMQMDHGKSMQAMMAGTHHLMVKVLDEKSGKAVSEGHVMINVTPPTGKSSMVHLVVMKDHFGGSAALDAKGEYKLGLSYKFGDKSGKTEFSYELK